MLWSKFLQEYGAAFRLVNVEKGYRKIPIPPPSAILAGVNSAKGSSSFTPMGRRISVCSSPARQARYRRGRAISKGGSTFLLANAAPKSVPIYSIDLAPQDDEKLKRLFEATNESSL